MTLAWLPPAITSAPPLLLAAGAAFTLGIVGSLLGRFLPGLGRLVRGFANVALVCILLLTGLRFVQLDPALEALLPQFGMPGEQVVGSETRVPLASDGHFWLMADVNGTPQRFMVDTGATLSALSAEAARAAAVRLDPLRLPVIVRTANGPANAQLAKVDELQIGSVSARDLDIIVTGGSGGLNVLGMNFLNRLKSWRVEDGVLVLTPKSAG